MSRLRNLPHKTLLTILTGRWEPMEIVLSLSAMAHGLWLNFPYWMSNHPGISDAPQYYEHGLGFALVLAAVLHMAGLATGKFGLRKHAAFIKFILWGFLTWLAAFATGASSAVWFPFATITLLSGLVYLGISVRLPNGIN